MTPREKRSFRLGILTLVIAFIGLFLTLSGVYPPWICILFLCVSIFLFIVYYRRKKTEHAAKTPDDIVAIGKKDDLIKEKISLGAFIAFFISLFVFGAALLIGWLIQSTINEALGDTILLISAYTLFAFYGILALIAFVLAP